MKKTTQINIGGRHFYMDDDAYQKLNHYLESLKVHFSGEGEAGKEILDDIEQRIAELLDGRVTNGKQVVNLSDVNEIIKILGKVEDFEYAGSEEQGQRHYTYGDRRRSRRFYRDPDDYYLGGVSGGLGKYFDIDPIWIRLAFVIMSFVHGSGIIVYIILWIVIPKARTTGEKLQMRGRPVNLSTIKDSVNEEYQRFQVSDSADAVRTGFGNLIRSLGLILVAFVKFLIGVVGVLFLVAGSALLAFFIMGILGLTDAFDHVRLWDGFYLPEISGYFANPTQMWLAGISLAIMVLVPVIALIYGGVKILFDIKSRAPVLQVTLLTLWIVAICTFFTLLAVNARSGSVEASDTSSTVIETGKHPHIVLDTRDNTRNKSIKHYRIMGSRFRYSKYDDALYINPRLTIEQSADDRFRLQIERKTHNIGFHSEDFLDEVYYDWSLEDSVLYLDKYFYIDDDAFWTFAEVYLTLQVPKGQSIVLRESICNMLIPEQRRAFCDYAAEGNKWLMSPDGSLIQAN